MVSSGKLDEQIEVVGNSSLSSGSMLRGLLLSFGAFWAFKTAPHAV
jgi:hypothetical protein